MGALLENSPEGKIITNSEWNAVMGTIRNAVNNNADNLTLGIVSYLVQIHSTTNIQGLFKWSLEDPTADPFGYYVTIPKDAHNIAGFPIVRVFSIDTQGYLTEIYGGITINPDRSVTIRSRKNVNSYVLIQGVDNEES